MCVYSEHSSESSLTDGDKSVLELDSTVEHPLQDKSEERESEADDSVVDEARCNEEINSHLPIVKKVKVTLLKEFYYFK